MITKAKPVEINSEKPFEHDVLKREKYADILTQVLSPVTHPFVITINSSFGTGKTTFIRMWRQKLQNAGFTTLLFNAWENDFTENALISMLGEVRQDLAVSKGEDKHFRKAALEAGKVLAKVAIPILARVATAGVVDGGTIAEAVGGLSEKIAEERIKSYEADKNTIQKFKEELARFVKSKSPDKPVFFFIDELDRCRPLFAIEVLEHVKHLFDAPGLIFLLSVDRQQLGHSLCAVYGTGMDLDGYLRRFVDLDYRLPDPEPRDFVTALCDSVEDLKSNWRQNVLEGLSMWATFLGLSLRTIEQVFTQIILTGRLVPDPHFRSAFLVTLTCIKARSTKEYEEYLRDGKGAEKFVGYLERFEKGEATHEQRLVARNLRVMIQVFPLDHKQVHAWMKGREEAAEKEQDQRTRQSILYECQIAEEFGYVRVNKSSLLDCIEVTRDFLKDE